MSQQASAVDNAASLRPPQGAATAAPAAATTTATTTAAAAAFAAPPQSRSAAERLQWAPQPVHSEDAFDENDAVAAALRASADAAERRRALFPGFLQHLA